MRTWTLCTCTSLALINPVAALAQSQAGPSQVPAAGAASAPVAMPKPQQAPPELAKLLEGKVRAAWEAFKRKDKNAYAKFLTDDFQAVESDGDGERAKYLVLREVEHCTYTDYLLQLFQVQQLEKDHAFVTYESTMRFPKTAVLKVRRVFVGELWVRQSGDWKMMRYQETVVR
jgi:hypothetical protein